MSYEVERPTRRSGTASDVMCAVDDVDGQQRFVIADIAHDDTWISMVADETCLLTAWR
ncbi:hypothetical protein NDI54_16290 [Haloarcula sp. S1AR25-5A]|uniref:Uncharacterized protein n=1 Tax=Haloarcula terrestris TaxID=2950533 RepID=A0AAE4JIT1_9EURY|nr:hypothetical protein [Haloarcula terrestris]MDS0222905.1 hypothetical protein [Haloarcula terrestris]